MSNAEEKEKAGERFIPSAIAIHGDLYDYSKVIYNGTDTNVIIICRTHGEFLKTPYKHINKKEGCKKCSAARVRLRNLRKRRVISKTYKESEYKRCPKCGQNKKKSDFYNDKNSLSKLSGQCKRCLNGPIKIKPPKMYKYYKLCCVCKECKTTDEFSKNGSKSDGLASMCKNCEKINRISRTTHIRKYRKGYYEDNREVIIQKEAEYKSRLALYAPYASNLTAQENPVDKEGMLFVKCKNCGKLFQPTNSAVRARIYSLNNFGTGESHLYCSDNCKESCDIFKAISKRKSERGGDKISRKCQVHIKKELQRLQCDDAGTTYCEKCGDIMDVELHHTNMVKDKKDVNNPAGMLLLCFHCHMELHAQCA